MQRKARAVAVLVLASSVFVPALQAQQQQTLSPDDQYRVSEILRDAHDEVKKHYFDPKMHGLDWDARYQQYMAMVPKVHNLGEGFGVVAAFLGSLEDSHVYFIPPSRAHRYDDGYRLSLIGNDCFVTQVRPKSDAESKLHVGDQVLTLDGYNINRGDFHDLMYYFHALSPMPAAQLVVRSPGEPARSIVVNHSVKSDRQEVDLTISLMADDLITREVNSAHTSRPQIKELEDITVWKLQRFDLDDTDVDHFMRIARKHNTLILDLRGNPGGRTDTLQNMLGSLFGEDVKIADRVERKSTKEMIARPQGKPFIGKLIVLIDSGSASASELYARVVQIQHRGTVIGDKSAGAVMEARIYDDERGTNDKFFYRFCVTEANLIMTDGQSLEKTGVTPDEQVLPTGADLAAGRDPVLARAIQLAGGKMEPVEAAKMFPYEWAPL